MNENDYIKIIEKLNTENIELRNSKEFKIGKNIMLLKKKSIFSLVLKMIKRKKIGKYNAHCEQNNNYEYKQITRRPRIAIYTCITGNYDNIIEPIIKPQNIDYFMFSDNINKETSIWQIKNIPEKLKDCSNILTNRYIKMHPTEFFEDYDYAIYIDGNVQVVSDLTDWTYTVNENTGISMHKHQFRNCIYDEVEVCKIRKKGNYKMLKKQVSRYEENGFPKKFGMLEATVIVSKIKDNKALKLFEDWWEEFKKSEALRDQISLQYIIWKNKLTIDDFGILGENVYKNPKIRVNIH